MSVENGNTSSKVAGDLKIDEYNAGAYLSLTEFLGYYGLSDEAIQKLPGAKVTRFKDMVNNGNRTVESALYPFNDQIPLAKSSESFTYAKSMAKHWAEYEKAAEEGAPNTKAKEKLWAMDRDNLIRVMKSQPQKVNQRRVIGSNFEDRDTQLYSQTYGQQDFL